MFSALVPALDSQPASRFNCVVGRFSAQNNVLDPELLLIDTTRVRVADKGTANLKTEQIDLLPVRGELFFL